MCDAITATHKSCFVPLQVPAVSSVISHVAEHDQTYSNAGIRQASLSHLIRLQSHRLKVTGVQNAVSIFALRYFLFFFFCVCKLLKS